MHVLHKILVYKEEGFDVTELEQERIDEARSLAEYDTEKYFEEVYDWRETETAGAWSDEYPKQVYFASDDIDWFINEIKEAVASQKAEAEMYMKEIKEHGGINLEDIVSVLMDDNLKPEAPSARFASAASFALLKLSRLLYGDYDIDSGIYNLASSSARIYNEDIEQIKQEPNKWAIVMFDYHY